MIAEPTEYPLGDLKGAMAALSAARLRMGLELVDLESTSGVSVSSFHAWKALDRTPTLGNFIAVAQTLGFEVVLKHVSGRETVVSGIKVAMKAVQAEIKSKRWTLSQCEKASGVSRATYSHLSYAKHDARIPTLVAIGKAFGLTLLLRRRTLN